jgi:hypothetical protein
VEFIQANRVYVDFTLGLADDERAVGRAVGLREGVVGLRVAVGLREGVMGLREGVVGLREGRRVG